MATVLRQKLKNENKEEIFNKCLLKWAKQFKRDFVWRHNRTPYKIFVAEVLLKRTTSKAAAGLFNRFINKYPSLLSLEKSRVEELEDFFKPIGLYKQRSKMVKESTRYLVNSLNGEFPDIFDELIKIPSIGPYSAACILSFGMDIPIPAIDSNGIRVLTRVFQNDLGQNSTYNKVFSFASRIFPKKRHVLFNYGLIDFGATICSYRGCNSDGCPFCDICNSFVQKNAP